MSKDVTQGLPPDLVAVLRDQSVVLSRDAVVFDLIAAWAKAPTPTASAIGAESLDMPLVEAMARQTDAARATTGADCSSL